jgi:hypothetical protein
MSVSKLFPANGSTHNSNNSFKYKISCQEKINPDNPDTRDWLELLSKLEHDSPTVKLYKGLLEKSKSVVAKVGRVSLQHEFEIGSRLINLHIPSFLGFHCNFQCLDDFNTLNTASKFLCKERGEAVNVLLMPYVDGQRIDEHRWTREQFPLLKNILKHVVLSLLYASLKIQFIHGDLHLGNVMIKKTSRKKISYGEFGDLECMGFIPVIMDYDRSSIGSGFEGVYKDIKRFISLSENYLDIQLDPLQVGQLSRMLLTIHYEKKEVLLRYKDICSQIDQLEILRIKSEKPPAINFTKF